MRYTRLFLLFFCLANTAIANAQTTPDMATGLSPYATYTPGEIDNYNPANGNVFIKIPVLGYPQRGGKLRLNFYIYYNDKQWQANMQINTPSYGSPYLSAYWTPSGLSLSGSSALAPFPIGAYIARDQFLGSGTNYNQTSVQTIGQGSDEIIESTSYLTQYVFTPDSAIHYVGDGVKESVGCGPLVPSLSCPSVPSWGNGQILNKYPATDGSNYTFTQDPEGITYSGNAAADPNGNSITWSSTGWTDTVGRILPGGNSGPGANEFPNASGYSGSKGFFDLIPGVPLSSVPSQCPGGTSAARIWTVPSSSSNGGTANYYLCYTYLSFQTAFNIAGSLMPMSGITVNSPPDVGSSSGFGQALLLTAVVLPDGNAYTFQYDQYLSLTQLGLPSGGTIAYTWQNIAFRPLPAVNYGWGGIPTPISRALTSRTVSPGNGQPAITTTYQWNITTSSSITGTNFNQGVVFPAYNIVTDPNGNDTEYTLGGTDDYGVMWNDYVITGVASYSGCSPHHGGCAIGTGTRIKSTTYGLTAVTSGGAPSVSPASIPLYPYLPPSKVTQTTTHLPSSGGDLLARSVSTLTAPYGSCNVYTYPVYFTSGTTGSATQFSSTQIGPCYQTGQVASTATYDYGAAGSGLVGPLIKTQSITYAWQNSAAVLNANMMDLVARSVISDGSGNWIAETDKCFDSYGNNTGVEQLASASSSPSCSSPPAGALVSTAQFNSQGVMTAKSDALGHQTRFDNFACSGTFPGTVTAAFGSTTTTPETSTYSYDCNTGKVTAAQDANNQTTTFTYADPLNRVTGAHYPDGGSITVSYNDSSQPLTMTVTKATGDASGAMSTTTTYDGLARKILTQTGTGAPGLSVSVATNYDNLGRESSVSNAYYSMNDSTFGWTSWQYDALGRKIYQCNPDNGTSAGACAPGKSYEKWVYDGNSTGTTNENGNTWVHTADALGRLTKVVEPGSLVARYSYDSLGNLLCSVQQGTSSQSFSTCVNAPASWRPRSFVYDAFSRLQSSTNPESGTVTYRYDADGNVLSRIDGRNVTTSYSYDDLNRPLARWYSDGTTPISCYQYDSSSVTNGIGRLASAWTELPGSGCANSPSSGSFLAARWILAYDQMGRPTSAQQQHCVNGKCSAAAPYSLTLAYDLAGNLTSYTNSVGAAGSSLTLTNAYDAAGRPCLTVSSWTLPNSANNPTAPANIFQSDPSSSASSTGYVAPGGLQNWYLGGTSSTASTGCSSTPASSINLQQTFVPRLWVTNFSATGQVP